jgi:hypothetical protein
LFQVSISSASTKVLQSGAGVVSLTGDQHERIANPRRSRIERRQCHPLLTDWQWAFRGRRKATRRKSDQQCSSLVLDWYHPSLLFFVVATYVMSGIDAVLTFTLVEFGITEEANPVMNMLLAHDVRLFFGVKSLVTGLGLVSLAIYSKLSLFTRIRIELIIYALFAIYAALITYEITLLRMAEASY